MKTIKVFSLIVGLTIVACEKAVEAESDSDSTIIATVNYQSSIVSFESSGSFSSTCIAPLDYDFTERSLDLLTDPGGDVDVCYSLPNDSGVMFVILKNRNLVINYMNNRYYLDRNSKYAIKLKKDGIDSLHDIGTRN